MRWFSRSSRPMGLGRPLMVRPGGCNQGAKFSWKSWRAARSMPGWFSSMMSGLLGGSSSLPGAGWFCCASNLWLWLAHNAKDAQRRNFFLYLFQRIIWQRLSPWFVFRFNKRSCLVCLGKMVEWGEVCLFFWRRIGVSSLFVLLCVKCAACWFPAKVKLGWRLWIR